MVFHAVFNSISVILWRPVIQPILSWSSFKQYAAQYSRLSKPQAAFPHNHCGNIVETMGSVERGMNPVAMTIINPQKEYWPSRRSNQRLPVLRSCTLPTELWGSASGCQRTILHHYSVGCLIEWIFVDP